MTTPDASWKPAVDVVYHYLGKGATTHPSDTLCANDPLFSARDLISIELIA